MPLARRELALVRTAVEVYRSAAAVPLPLEPLAVVFLASAGDKAAAAVDGAVLPLAYVDVAIRVAEREAVSKQRSGCQGKTRDISGVLKVIR